MMSIWSSREGQSQRVASLLRLIRRTKHTDLLCIETVGELDTYSCCGVTQKPTGTQLRPKIDSHAHALRSPSPIDSYI